MSRIANLILDALAEAVAKRTAASAAGAEAAPKNEQQQPSTSEAREAAPPRQPETPEFNPGEIDKKLLDQLRRDEGFVGHAYQDHLGYWTIGIGRLIDRRRGGGITEAEARYLLANDVARVTEWLRGQSWFRAVEGNPARRRALINMAFQLGTGGMKEGAARTFSLLERGDFAGCAARLRGWLWAKQTPARAERVIRAIETGED